MVSPSMITVGCSIPICLPCFIRHRTSLAQLATTQYILLHGIPQLRFYYLWYTCQYNNQARIVLELCNVHSTLWLKLPSVYLLLRKTSILHVVFHAMKKNLSYQRLLTPRVFFKNARRLGLGRIGLNSFVAFGVFSAKLSALVWHCECFVHRKM